MSDLGNLLGNPKEILFWDLLCSSPFLKVTMPDPVIPKGEELKRWAEVLKKATKLYLNPLPELR